MIEGERASLGFGLALEKHVIPTLAKDHPGIGDSRRQLVRP